MQISFISKVSRVHEATTVKNDTSFCFTILVFFSWISSRSTGAEIPYEQTTKYDLLTEPARFPGTYEEALISHNANYPCSVLKNMIWMWQSRGNVVRMIQISTRFNKKKNMRNAQNIHRKSKTNCWNSKATTWTQYFENEVAYDSQAFSFAFHQAVR